MSNLSDYMGGQNIFLFKALSELTILVHKESEKNVAGILLSQLKEYLDQINSTFEENDPETVALQDSFDIFRDLLQNHRDYEQS